MWKQPLIHNTLAMTCTVPTDSLQFIFYLRLPPSKEKEDAIDSLYKTNEQPNNVVLSFNCIRKLRGGTIFIEQFDESSTNTLDSSLEVNLKNKNINVDEVFFTSKPFTFITQFTQIQKANNEERFWRLDFFIDSYIFTHMKSNIFYQVWQMLLNCFFMCQLKSIDTVK